MKRGTKKKRVLSLTRTILILVACFAATILILQSQMDKRSDQAALDTLPGFASQSGADVDGAVSDLTSSLHTAAQVLAASGGPQSAAAQEMLDALAQSAPFAQTGIRRPDGMALFNDGTEAAEEDWNETLADHESSGDVLLGKMVKRRLGGQQVWTIRLFVNIPNSEDQLFGTVRVDDLFRRSFLYGLQGGDRHVIVFETETGSILLDTLHRQTTLGQDFYGLGLLTPEEVVRRPEMVERIPSVQQDGGRLYVYPGTTGVSGWRLCAVVKEASGGPVLGGGIPTDFAYGLLFLLYALAAAVLLLYQTMRERAVRDRLDAEVARRNFLMNAALPGSDTQVFEVLPDGMLRLLAPRLGQGEALKSMMISPARLLLDLNCDPQWEPALAAAMEQAAAGQDSEVEFQTRDVRESWVRLRLEPMPNGEGAAAIGTIRDVTQQVKERRRQEALSKLLDRMMVDTIAGLEVSLEEDRWRVLWGREAYASLKTGAETRDFRSFIAEQVLPMLDPEDRETYRSTVDPDHMLEMYRAGNVRLNVDYRVLGDQPGAYTWRSTELYFFENPTSHKAMCNLFVHQIMEEKLEELEERRRLEEKEHQIFLMTKKLMESEDQLDFVHVIADYYQGIFVVDFTREEIRAIKVPAYFQQILEEAGYRPVEVLRRFAERQLLPQYIPGFRSLTSPAYLQANLIRRETVEMLYQRPDGKWTQMRIFPMSGYTAANQVTLWVFEDETFTVSLRQEEEKARVTAEAAEAANQAKSQFLANMSHEIRTPLNAILGLSEMALREADSREKDACLRDIRGSGQSLLENINSILDLSKIEEGKMELDPENYNILSMLHDTILVLRLRAQEKKLAFIPEIDAAMPNILYGDDGQISHIIMNLGSNAVKYTQKGSVTMVVTWEPGETDGTLVIRLKDTGVGIRQSDLPYLFQSYGRLDRKANRHIEGTGLGLTIVKNLTEMMGGEVGVESVYGQGSEFWVRIPQKVVDASPCGAYRERRHREDVEPESSFAAPEAVVLVVDDQPINLKICRGLLQPYGMQVHTASSGAEALEKMTEVWPDLVFMDHMMPDMDGVETTARIRAMGEKDPYFAVVPIIALTANAMKGMREFFLRNGFNDYVPKPIELDWLDEVLRRWVPDFKQEAADQPLRPEPAPEELRDVPGLDAEKGMSFAGTAEAYRQTLAMFRSQLGERIEKIRRALAEEDRESYVIEVHSLKSAARWVGALELGDQAEALELAGKENRWEQAARDTPALLDACAELETALSAVLLPA